MFSPLFTASEIDRLFNCSASASLIQLKNQSPAGVQGTKDHAKYLRPGGLPKHCRLWLCGNDPKNAPEYSQDRFEASFEYDPESNQARYLGSNLERAYELSRPNLTGGTLDVWNWWLDGNGLHIRIADLKTGFAQSSGDLPDPWDAWQLRWAALATAAAVTQDPEFIDQGGATHILVLVSWFVPDEFGTLEIKEAHQAFSLDDLETFRQDLEQLRQQMIKQAGSTWREGPWCERCPAFIGCPVKRGVLEKLGLLLEGPITAEAVVQLHRTKQALKKLCKAADDIEEQYLVTHGQLQTRPGYVLGVHPVRRKSLASDAVEKAKQVLTAVPIEESLDLEGLRDILGPDGYQSAVQKLVEVGAIRMSNSLMVRETRRQD